VVLCPGRGERWLTWLKDLLTQAGAKVKVTSATEHDRLMAVVQGLSHFVLIALERSIRQLGVSLKDLEDYSTPTFDTLHRLAKRLLSQDAQLYACIQVANPANRTALRALDDAVADILYFVQRQDANGLVRLLEEIQEGFGED
jgi:prephenate dehydrogenase